MLQHQFNFQEQIQGTTVVLQNVVKNHDVSAIMLKKNTKYMESKTYLKIDLNK